MGLFFCDGFEFDEHGLPKSCLPMLEPEVLGRGASAALSRTTKRAGAMSRSRPSCVRWLFVFAALLLLHLPTPSKCRLGDDWGEDACLQSLSSGHGVGECCGSQHLAVGPGPLFAAASAADKGEQVADASNWNWLEPVTLNAQGAPCRCRGAYDGIGVGSVNSCSPCQRVAHSEQTGPSSSSSLPPPPPTSPPADLPALQVVLHPLSIDWKEQELCRPVQRTITIINHSDHHDLKLTSVSSDSKEFSFVAFQPLVLSSGGGQAVLQILYVPQALGPRDALVKVHTNAGTFGAQMHGWGIPSSFGLVPFLNLKALVGQTLSKDLRLHNPHSSAIQVREVYTNDDSLRLHLPKTDNDSKEEPCGHGPAGLWEVPAQKEKVVMVVDFVAQSPGTYGGLIHLRVDQEDQEELAIPVEIDAVKGGLHWSPSELDFGLLTRQDEVKTRELRVYNAGSKPVDVFDIYVEPEDKRLEVKGFEFLKGVVVYPEQEVVVAQLLLRVGPSKATHLQGRVVIYTDSTQLEVPYKAQILYGELQYPFANSTFLASSGGLRQTRESSNSSSLQSLPLTNGFPVPLLFYSAKVQGTDNIKVVNFPSGALALPSSEGPVVILKFQDDFSGEPYSATLELYTNLTTLEVPLHVHLGKLNCSELSLNLGQMAEGELRTAIFNLTNPTVVPVWLFSVWSDLPYAQVKVNGFWDGDAPVELSKESKEALTTPGNLTSWRENGTGTLSLSGGQVLTFTVQVADCHKEGTTEGHVLVRTEHEVLSIPLSFEVVTGSVTVTPNPAVFGPSFPHLLLTIPIWMEHTFSRPLTIHWATFSHRMLVAELTKREVPPGNKTEIGILWLVPAYTPSAESYLADSSFWATALQNHTETSAKSCLAVRQAIKETEARKEKWKAFVSETGRQVKGWVKVETDLVKGHQVPVHMELVYPALMNWTYEKSRDHDVDAVPVVKFSVVQVEMQAVQSIPIRNPSHAYVEVELFLAEEVNGSGPINCGREVHGQGRGWFGLPPEAVTHTILAPYASATLGPIAFRPSGLSTARASFFIRSNFTLLETGLLEGEGGAGVLEFLENGKPVDKLQFNLTGGQLGFQQGRKGWEKANQGVSWPVVVNRQFRAVNTGNMALQVHGLQVASSRGCKGYGFAIKTCSGFRLEPGHSQIVHISYQPDLSSSFVQQELRIATSLGLVSFPLVAQLPHSLLPLCLQAFPITPEELTQKRFTITTLLAFLILIAVIACKELLPLSPSALLGLAHQATKRSSDERAVSTPCVNELPSSVPEAPSEVDSVYSRSSSSASRSSPDEQENGEPQPVEDKPVRQPSLKSRSVPSEADVPAGEQGPALQVRTVPVTTKAEMEKPTRTKKGDVKPRGAQVAPEPIELTDSGESDLIDSPRLQAHSPAVSPYSSKKKKRRNTLNVLRKSESTGTVSKTSSPPSSPIHRPSTPIASHSAKASVRAPSLFSRSTTVPLTGTATSAYRGQVPGGSSEAKKAQAGPPGEPYSASLRRLASKRAAEQANPPSPVEPPPPPPGPAKMTLADIVSGAARTGKKPAQVAVAPPQKPPKLSSLGEGTPEGAVGGSSSDSGSQGEGPASGTLSSFDTLGSIGKRSMEADRALGDLVYDIWGNHFGDFTTRAPPVPPIKSPRGQEKEEAGHMSSLFGQKAFQPPASVGSTLAPSLGLASPTGAPDWGGLWAPEPSLPSRVSSPGLPRTGSPGVYPLSNFSMFSNNAALASAAPPVSSIFCDPVWSQGFGMQSLDPLASPATIRSGSPALPVAKPRAVGGTSSNTGGEALGPTSAGFGLRGFGPLVDLKQVGQASPQESTVPKRWNVAGRSSSFWSQEGFGSGGQRGNRWQQAEQE